MNENKNKKISVEQINAVLQIIYQTNIPAQQFDAVKKLLAELPDVEVKKKSKNAREL